MKILVQTNKRPQVHLEHEFKMIEAAGYDPVPYGYIKDDKKNTVTILGLEDIGYDECVFNRPSIQILKKHFIDKATFIGDIPRGFFTSLDYSADDFCISKMRANPLMINKYPGGYKFIPLKDILHLKNSHDTFYKPDNDLKLIAGTFVRAGLSLYDTLTEDGKEYAFSEDQLNATILQSTNIVKFKEEVRCFVVNGESVTAARYRRNGQGDLTKLTLLEEAFYLSHANIYINDYYSPGKSFTIDLGLLADGGVYIIEYNCINTSGMYNINSKALFSKIKANICVHK